MSHSDLAKNKTKKADLDDDVQKRTIPFWLHSPPDERRCHAISKQAGRRCKLYAVPGKRVCRYHGGKSTGPKEPAIKHGEHALEMLKARAAIKVKTAAEKEKICFLYDFGGWVEGRLMHPQMNYAEFRRVRPAMAAFIRGKLSAQRLAKVIEGKV